LHASHGIVELILKDLNSLNWALLDIIAESWVELAHFINVDVESVSSSDHVSNSLLCLMQIHEFVGSVLHVVLELVRVVVSSNWA